ncbi:MAG: transglutaminase-like domain-containing protein [Promethearchaeota archaeon]
MNFKKIFALIFILLIYITLSQNSQIDEEIKNEENIQYNFTYIVNILSKKHNNKEEFKIIYFNTSSLYHTILSSNNNFDNEASINSYNDDNTVYVFNLNMNKNEIVTLSQSHIIKFESKINSLNYTIKENDIYDRYIKNDHLIESNEETIISKGNEITINITNPFDKCVAINNWVHNNLNYTGYNKKTLGALYALNNLEGDCSEYSHLFIALCRSQGIPSRQVNGLINIDFSTQTQNWDISGHDWSEVYFSGCGWIWFDPTIGWTVEPPILYIPLQYGTFENSGNYRYKYSPPNTILVNETFIFYKIDK